MNVLRKPQRPRISGRRTIGSLLFLALVPPVIAGCTGPLASVDTTPPPVALEIPPDTETDELGLVQFGGSSLAVALDGPVAFLGVGPRVVALDVTEPNNIVAIAQSPMLDGVVQSVAVDLAPEQHRIWVAIKDAGVVVLVFVEDDDTKRLVPLHSMDTPGPARDVTLRDGFAYIGYEPAGVQIMEAGEAPPRVRGNYSVPNAEPEAWDIEDLKLGVAVAEQHAYLVTTTIGMHVVDVSDPDAPRRVGVFEPSRPVFDVDLHRDLAYLAGTPLRIVEVSDPTNPRLLWPASDFSERQDAHDERFRAQAHGVAYADGVVVATNAVFEVENAVEPGVTTLPYGSRFGRPALREGIAFLPVGEHGGGLHVLDVRNPAEPLEITRLDTIGVATGVSAEGSRLWVEEAFDRNGFSVDVSQPARPAIVAFVPGDQPQPRHAQIREGMIVETDRHSIIAEDGNLTIYEGHFSEPQEQPEVEPLATLTISSNPHRIIHQGDYLYIADSGWDWDIIRSGPKWFEIVDISNPAEPNLAGSLSFTYPLDAVAVQGDTAWVIDRRADHFLYREPLDTDVVAIDISDPANPSELSRATSGAPAHDLQVGGDLLHAATDEGWQRFGISDPQRLQDLGTFSLPGRQWQMSSDGDMLWFASWESGIVGIPTQLDVQSLPRSRMPPVFAQSSGSRKSPALVPTATPYPQRAELSPSQHVEARGRVGGLVTSLAREGSMLYLGHGPNVAVMQVQEGIHPLFRGRSTMLAAEVLRVIVRDSIVYAALGEAGIAVVDATNPMEPATESSGIPMSYTDLLALGEGMLFAGSKQDGRVRVLDLSDPLNPEEIAIIDTGEAVSDMAFSADHLYIAGGRQGLQIFDLRLPSQPRTIEGFESDMIATAISITGNHAYLIDGETSLRIVDIEDPVKVREIGRMQSDHGITGLGWHEGRLIMMNRESQERFRIVDVSDPKAPREIETTRSSSGWGRGDFTVVNDLIYVTDTESAGLYALPLDPDALMSTPARDPHRMLDVLDTSVFRTEMSDEFVAVTSSGTQHIIDLRESGQPRQTDAIDLDYQHMGISGEYLLAGSRRDFGKVTLYDLSGEDGVIRLASTWLDDPSGPPEAQGFRFDHVRYPAPKPGMDHERDIVTATRLGTGADQAPEAVFDIGYGKYASTPFFGEVDPERGLLVTGGETLRVFDITASPAQALAELPLEGDGHVTLEGEYAYRAASYDKPIEIIDLSDPSTPQVVATFEVDGNIVHQADNVASSQAYLYIVQHDDTHDTFVQVYDLSDPLAPRPIDRFTKAGTLASIDSIHATGDRLIVAGWGGVFTYRIAGRSGP